MLKTKKEFTQFRTDVDSAIADVLQKYTMSAKIGRITYTDNSMKMSIEFLNVGFDKAKEEFENDCFLVDLKKSDFKKHFKIHDEVFELVGLKLNRHKYPLQMKKVSPGKGQGATYKMPLESSYGGIKTLSNPVN